MPSGICTPGGGVGGERGRERRVQQLWLQGTPAVAVRSCSSRAWAQSGCGGHTHNMSAHAATLGCRHTCAPQYVQRLLLSRALAVAAGRAVTARARRARRQRRERGRRHPCARVRHVVVVCRRCRGCRRRQRRGVDHETRATGARLFDNVPLLADLQVALHVVAVSRKLLRWCVGVGGGVGRWYGHGAPASSTMCSSF
eukprot:366559-Chlamydomonas_euryale.AAC.19